MSILLGAKHAVSILFVWFIADLGIGLVMYLLLYGRTFGKDISLSAQSSNMRRVGLA